MPSTLTIKELKDILSRYIPFDDTSLDDGALRGLVIIHKYVGGCVLQAAEHDIIYSVSVQTLVRSGITEEDATLLRTYGWGVEDDTLRCYV